jgi:F-type H+-transporting ATPase subunit epsilon
MRSGLTGHVRRNTQCTVVSRPSVAPEDLSKNTPLNARVKPGALRIKVASRDEEEFVFVASAILEVQPNGVTVLADTAIRGHDPDEAKALAAKKLAEESMVSKESKIDYATAQAELETAIAQLAAIAKLRQKNR